MPQPPDWKRVLETGMHFTELRRSQAYRVAADLVAQGQLARDQIGAAVDELVEISRRRSEELRAIVGAEVQRQLGGLGLATKRDLDALEHRLRASVATRAPAGKPGATKAPAKKVAKKAAKKAPARKAPPKKATVKKATAAPRGRKAAAKKTVRTAVARRGAIRKAARKTAAKRTR